MQLRAVVPSFFLIVLSASFSPIVSAQIEFSDIGSIEESVDPIDVPTTITEMETTEGVDSASNSEPETDGDNPSLIPELDPEIQEDIDEAFEERCLRDLEWFRGYCAEGQVYQLDYPWDFACVWDAAGIETLSSDLSTGYCVECYWDEEEDVFLVSEQFVCDATEIEILDTTCEFDSDCPEFYECDGGEGDLTETDLFGDEAAAESDGSLTAGVCVPMTR